MADCLSMYVMRGKKYTGVKDCNVETVEFGKLDLKNRIELGKPV